MKKILLIATMLCCMTSLMAQSFEGPSFPELMKDGAFRAHLNNTEAKGITHRVDSIVLLNGLAKIASVYDQRYTCVRDSIFLLGAYFYSFEYTYNNLNQLIVVQGTDYSNVKYELSYNDQGLIKETLSYTNTDGNWILSEKTTTDYDANGNPTLEMQYTRNSSGEWENSSKTEFTSSNNHLIVKIESDWDHNVWNESEKTEYEYDATGECTNLKVFTKASDNSWSLESRNENTFDSHGNMTQTKLYSYNDETGETLSMVNTARYDLNVPASAVATSGYWGYADAENEVYKVKNLILSIEQYDPTDSSTAYTMYYTTDMTTVEEGSSLSLQVSPNPVHETLSLGAKDFRHVEIFTLDGKEVMQVRDGFEAIQVSQLANGCYVVRATMNDGSVATQKFVKQ